MGNVVFPDECLGCGREARDDGIALCATCRELVARVEEPRCPRCARRFESGTSIMCGSCEREPPPFDATSAFAVHAGPVAEAVSRFKYGAVESLARPLAAMARIALPVRPFDWVVPVPLHIARLRERGFNQACEIARRLGAGPVAARGLVRLRNTPCQAGLSARERRENVSGAFAVAPRFSARCRGARLLLVDDVFTTGATVRECAKELRRAGALAVAVAVITRAE